MLRSLCSFLPVSPGCAVPTPAPWPWLPTCDPRVVARGPQVCQRTVPPVSHLLTKWLLPCDSWHWLSLWHLRLGAGVLPEPCTKTPFPVLWGGALLSMWAQVVDLADQYTWPLLLLRKVFVSTLVSMWKLPSAQPPNLLGPCPSVADLRAVPGVGSANRGPPLLNHHRSGRPVLWCG